MRFFLLALTFLASSGLSCLDDSKERRVYPLDCSAVQSNGAGLEVFADSLNGTLQVRFRFVDLSLAKWGSVEVVGVVGGSLQQVITPMSINDNVLVFIDLESNTTSQGSFNFEALLQDPHAAEACGFRGELAFLMYGDEVRMSLRSVGALVDPAAN